MNDREAADSFYVIPVTAKNSGWAKGEKIFIFSKKGDGNENKIFSALP
jgi:hypothetical protein